MEALRELCERMLADIRVHHGRTKRVQRWTFPSRVGHRRALPDEALRGKVWKPFQGFHDN